MKKVILLLSAMLVATLASWAHAHNGIDHSGSEDSHREELREIRDEARQERREARGDFKDDRTEARETRKDEYKALREVCKEQLDAAETDEEEDQIKEDCKEEAEALREQYKDDLVEARHSYYESRKATFENRLRGTVALIDDLPDEQKQNIMERLDERLDELEERAMDAQNDDMLLLIQALRDALGIDDDSDDDTIDDSDEVEMEDAHFSWELESMSDDVYVVDGVEFIVDDATELDESLDVGDIVDVEYVEQEDGSFLALEIETDE